MKGELRKHFGALDLRSNIDPKVDYESLVMFILGSPIETLFSCGHGI